MCTHSNSIVVSSLLTLLIYLMQLDFNGYDVYNVSGNVSTVWTSFDKVGAVLVEGESRAVPGVPGYHNKLDTS